jgi:hypothetical protein
VEGEAGLLVALKKMEYSLTFLYNLSQVATDQVI